MCGVKMLIRLVCQDERCGGSQYAPDAASRGGTPEWMTYGLEEARWIGISVVRAPHRAARQDDQDHRAEQAGEPKRFERLP